MNEQASPSNTVGRIYSRIPKFEINDEQVKNKIKAVSGAASSTANGQKKRRKGQDLKPIITKDGSGAGKAQRYALTDFC